MAIHRMRKKYLKNDSKDEEKNINIKEKRK